MLRSSHACLKDDLTHLKHRVLYGHTDDVVTMLSWLQSACKMEELDVSVIKVHMHTCVLISTSTACVLCLSHSPYDILQQ
jgi:hypothetical protein